MGPILFVKMNILVREVFGGAEPLAASGHPIILGFSSAGGKWAGPPEPAPTRPARCLAGIPGSLWPRPVLSRTSPVSSRFQLCQTRSPGLAHWASLQMPSEHPLCARLMLGTGTLGCGWSTTSQEEAQLTEAGQGSGASRAGTASSAEGGRRAFTKGGLEK